MKRTLLCAATRLSRDEFWAHSLLGQSLRRFPRSLLPQLAFRFDNHGARCEGLSTVYNRALDQCPDDRHLLLVHDDVYLHDVFLEHRIDQGLDRFDVLGLAGSRHSDVHQPSWGLAFDDELRCLGWQNGGGRPSHVILSGAVSHTSTGGRRSLGATEEPAVALSEYGPLPDDCHLLDGLFLALDVERVRLGHVRFDEQFAFHLYDLDFCRSAHRSGLKLGTWPILGTHGSVGNFASDGWRDAARAYLSKWAPPRPSARPLTTASTPPPAPSP